MGYHLRHIKKGRLGFLSKIQEELDEATDAEEQNCKIMLLLELSDIIGAVEAVAEQNSSSLEELLKMNNLTKRAFKVGKRK